jgi:hypothetical protein
VICSACEPDPCPEDPVRETDWNGGLSSLAFDLHGQGYRVRTLPADGGRFTCGDPSNPLDLSGVDVLFIPECYTLFTQEEKGAIVRFVMGGGGLFLEGNHGGATRMGSRGRDAFHVFNDLFARNGVADGAFVLIFAEGHGPGDPDSDIQATAYAGPSPIADPILRGPFGVVRMQDFHAYAYLQVDTGLNPSAQGLLATPVSGDPSTDYLIAACTLGRGRVVAIGDSAPGDDGTTTTPGKHLRDNYDRNSHRAFFLNAVQWLAGN